MKTREANKTPLLPWIIPWVLAFALAIAPCVARADVEGLLPEDVQGQELVAQGQEPAAQDQEPAAQGQELVEEQDQALLEQSPELSAKNRELAAQDELDQATITAEVRMFSISSHGNVTISATCDALKEAFAYGDVVTVSFLGQSFDMPFCSNYSDVDSSMPGLFARPNNEYGVLAINMGSFAETYGMGIKQQDESGGTVWVCPEGVAEPIQVSIALKEAGGYYEEWVMHQLSYTNNREDYPQLSDEEFANFREVATTGMGSGILYRCASPVNSSRNRNTYADAVLKNAGVTVIVNLADTEEELVAFPGYDQTYYSTVQHVALGMGYDVASDEVRATIATGLRFMADNPGIYAVHCLEGKDRTGFVVALLECLMGATQDEVVADYMLTYYNYYGVTPEDARYDVIANGNIIKTLQRAFELESLDGANLAAEAEQYLYGLGLAESEVSALKANLTSYPPVQTVTVTFEMGGHGFAPQAQELTAGECATRPANPVARGYWFAGWYADEACTQRFDFAAPLEQDTTVYAKWVKAACPRPVINPAPVRPWMLPGCGVMFKPWFLPQNPYVPAPRPVIYAPWRWACCA